MLDTFGTSGCCKQLIIAWPRFADRFCRLSMGKRFFQFAAQRTPQNTHICMNVINAMCAVENHAGKCFRVVNQCFPSRSNKKHGTIVFDVYRAEGMRCSAIEELSGVVPVNNLTWQCSRVILAMGRQGAYKHKR